VPYLPEHFHPQGLDWFQQSMLQDGDGDCADAFLGEEAPHSAQQQQQAAKLQGQQSPPQQQQQQQGHAKQQCTSSGFADGTGQQAGSNVEVCL